MGNNTSAYSGSWSSLEYCDDQHLQGSGRPTSAYSRHLGAGMGSYTHYNQGGHRGIDKSVYIGRKRLAEQFPYRFPMSEITVSALGKVLIAECGNEGQHPNLSED